MINTIILNNPNYWNRAKSKDILNDILIEKDQKDSDLSLMVVKNEGLWTEDIEHLEKRFIMEPKELIKVNIEGEGTFISSSLQFVGKDIITHMKNGYVMIISHEIASLASHLEERYSNLVDWNDFSELVDLREAKVKKHKKTKPSKKDFEDPEEFEEASVEFSKKLRKLEEKLDQAKRNRNRLKEDLGMATLMGSYLINEAFYLFKNADMTYINKDQGLLILKINKKGSFTYKEYDSMTEIAEKCKDHGKPEAKDKIFEHFKTFNKIDFKIKVPVMQGFTKPILDEEVLEVNILTSIDMQDSIPAAPVKPSIAAAMLASGAGGKLDEEIFLEDEPCLIKTAITPIQLTESVDINGVEEVVKTFSWEPQLGLFNKLRKEFQILT